MLTSTIAPASGSLAALQDGNLATACPFAASAARSSGFALVWDFGAASQDVSAVRLGAGALRAEFADCLDADSQRCCGRVWRALARPVALHGRVFLMQAMPSDGDVYKSQTVYRCILMGPTAAPCSPTGHGHDLRNATTRHWQRLVNSSVFDGGGDGLSVPNSAPISASVSGDFTVELIVILAASRDGCVVAERTSGAVVVPFVIQLTGREWCCQSWRIHERIELGCSVDQLNCFAGGQLVSHR